MIALSPHQKARKSVAITGVLAAIVFILPNIGAHHKPPFPGKYGQPFNSEYWIKGSTMGCYNCNISMLDDFIARHKLVGLSRRRLHELLGCEGLTMQKTERQQISGPSCTDCHLSFVEIEFDTAWHRNPLQQTVSRFRLVDEDHPICAPGEIKITTSDWYN